MIKKKLNKGFVEIKEVHPIGDVLLHEVVTVKEDDESHDFVIGDIVSLDSDFIIEVPYPDESEVVTIIKCDFIYMSIQISDPSSN